MNEIRNRNREQNNPKISNKNIIPKNKVKSIKSIEDNNPTDKQLLSRMLLELHKISDPNSDILSSLIRLYKHIKKIHEIKILDRFCKQFPYADFINLVVNGENISIRNTSFAIFSFCTCSKYFPRGDYQNVEFVNLLLTLFSSFDEKSYVHIFRTLKELICDNPIIRDYILNLGVLNFFEQNPESFDFSQLELREEHAHELNTSIKAHNELFHKDSLEFLTMCLSYEPNIEPEFAIIINKHFKTVIDAFILDPVHHFSLIESLLMILPQRHKNGCSPVFNTEILSPEFAQFILNDLLRFGIEQSFIPIIKNAELCEIPDQQMISIVMTIFGLSQNESVLKVCLKQMQNNYQKWRIYPEIEQFLISILEKREEAKKLTFAIQKELMKILLIYIAINPAMNLSCLKFIPDFIEDKELSYICIQFIYQIVTLILQFGDPKQKEILDTIMPNILDAIERAVFGNMNIDNQVCAEETAVSIFNLYQNAQETS